MAQYIDKDAVVAKIEELDEFWHLSKSASSQAFVESLLSFLDILDVKEVDLVFLIFVKLIGIIINALEKDDIILPQLFKWQ